MKRCEIFFMVMILVSLVYGCSNENRKTKENGADVLNEEADRTEQTNQSDILLPEMLSEEEETSVEQTSQQEKVLNENLYEYTVELEEIPELAYASFSYLNSGDNYICYKDILILGNTIYKKEAGKYVKQEITLSTIFFDIEDEWQSVEARQYK
ncbi:MAG: hypothetical protein K2M91_06030, partial [Lachnospiraceae bacterium]|nr:hypothetical protein [Lachnospiraceae bacterium]